MTVCLQKRNTVLHYCVIYLAPGDYHGYHSPADWTVLQRRHFHGAFAVRTFDGHPSVHYIGPAGRLLVAGEMLSVRAKIVKHVPRLFCLNERVALLGHWTHGFMSMTPVAATNVGQIAIDDGAALSTNDARHALGEHEQVVYAQPMTRRRGERVGEFNMGSSVVLVFDAPETFVFTARSGEKLRYGQSLGIVDGGR